jgi:hypothetical protein
MSSLGKIWRGLFAVLILCGNVLAQSKESWMSHPTSYRTVKVDGLNIFYCEAGPKYAPNTLLLRGLPSSSRLFAPICDRRM